MGCLRVPTPGSSRDRAQVGVGWAGPSNRWHRHGSGQQRRPEHTRAHPHNRLSSYDLLLRTRDVHPAFSSFGISSPQSYRRGQSPGQLTQNVVSRPGRPFRLSDIYRFVCRTHSKLRCLISTRTLATRAQRVLNASTRQHRRRSGVHRCMQCSVRVRQRSAARRLPHSVQRSQARLPRRNGHRSTRTRLPGLS